MTKVELIRKIAKRNGVPDFEAKIFFEIFLHKVSSLLQPAQALKINGFGYFQLKKTSLKKSFNENENPNYSNVILFSPFDEEENHEEMIFNIPSLSVQSYDTIDSYFSLSFGKMAIPLKGVNDSDFFLPPTGLELKKLIESKVNKLISTSDIIADYVKGGEILELNNADVTPNQIDFNWNETEDYVQTEKDSSRILNDNSESDHVAWDFGEDLSKQIEEESILDTASEVSSLDWNFAEPEIAHEINDDEFNSSVNEKGSTETFTTRQFDERVADELKNFERVKSITSEFLPEEKEIRLTKSELDLSWDFGEPKISDEPKKNTITEFTETNLSDYQNTVLHDELMDQEDEIVEEENEVIPKNIPSILEEKSDTKFHAEEQPYSRKRSPIMFFIAMVTIITVSAVVILYFTKTNFFNLAGKYLKNNKEFSKVAQAEIIDRKFDVPVTYPYDKSSFQKSSNEIKPGALSNKSVINNSQQISQKNNLSELLNNSKPSKTFVQNQKGSVPSNAISQNNFGYTKVKDNIFKMNNGFVVQISSWRSSSIADNEMKKFKKKKLNSFVEKVSLPGHGIWYRVKVGDFKTLADAENFLNKNK